MSASGTALLATVTSTVWGGIAAYFVRRYVTHRRIVSLALAAMAVQCSITSSPAVSEAIGSHVLEILGLGLGCFVVYSILKVELAER